MNDKNEFTMNAYSLQRRHIATIQAHADATYDGNASMALRRIIDEWDAMRQHADEHYQEQVDAFGLPADAQGYDAAAQRGVPSPLNEEEK